jgi:hypothetical protein
MGGGLMEVQTTVAFNTENLGHGAWLVERVEIIKWGTEVVVHGIFYPDLPDTTKFQLNFKNCQLTTWETIENEFDARNVEADVIGFDVYHEDKSNRAVINTDLFELTITYGELVVHKDW